MGVKDLKRGLRLWPEVAGDRRRNVEAFAKVGIAVAFTYHLNEQGARQVMQSCISSDIAVDYYQLALHDEAATHSFMQQVKEKYVAVHSVVYAAGPAIPIDFVGSTSLEAWKNIFTQDTHACFNLIQAALPVLKDTGGGSITAVTTTQATRPCRRVCSPARPRQPLRTCWRWWPGKMVAMASGQTASVRAGWQEENWQEVWTARWTRRPSRRLQRKSPWVTWVHLKTSPMR